LAVTTTSVSDNTEFQNAIDNCAPGTICEIEIELELEYEGDFVDCSQNTLNVAAATNSGGENIYAEQGHRVQLIIKGTQPDGSRAVLDGGRVDGADDPGGIQVLKIGYASVTIDGVAIKNGAATYQVPVSARTRSHTHR